MGGKKVERGEKMFGFDKESLKQEEEREKKEEKKEWTRTIERNWNGEKEIEFFDMKRVSEMNRRNKKWK